MRTLLLVLTLSLGLTSCALESKYRWGDQLVVTRGFYAGCTATPVAGGYNLYRLNLRCGDIASTFLSDIFLSGDDLDWDLHYYGGKPPR